MKSANLIAAALLGTLVATQASADDFALYGEVEGWKVYVDNEKHSCLIEAVDAQENVVQMGLTHSEINALWRQASRLLKLVDKGRIETF